MPTQGLFSSYYFAPIEYYYYLTHHSVIIEDLHENFVKQTYRSRCYILSPNGIQTLSIPLERVKRKKPFKDVKITYDENWQKLHWKSFEAAYRSSPYFEYYEDEFEPIFTKKNTFLKDLNEEVNAKLLKLIKLDVSITKTSSYLNPDKETTDYRTIFSPKIKESKLVFPKYIQVFNDRNAFAPNLSIVDLLFNEGPNTINYLKTIRENA
jgi:hypothetical protein